MGILSNKYPKTAKNEWRYHPPAMGLPENGVAQIQWTRIIKTYYEDIKTTCSLLEITVSWETKFCGNPIQPGANMFFWKWEDIKSNKKWSSHHPTQHRWKSCTQNRTRSANFIFLSWKYAISHLVLSSSMTFRQSFPFHHQNMVGGELAPCLRWFSREEKGTLLPSWITGNSHQLSAIVWLEDNPVSSHTSWPDRNY